jgi:hypothetical protein
MRKPRVELGFEIFNPVQRDSAIPLQRKSHHLDGFVRKYLDSRIEVNDDAGSQYSNE